MPRSFLAVPVLLALCAGLPVAATAEPLSPREGWALHASQKDYDTLLADTLAAVAQSPLAVVTQAGPTGAARARGVEIPGNRVIGVFNNLYAVEVLGLSTAAMIEAPIRLYVTENADGTATLSYKTPSHVFAEYLDEGGPRLSEIAAEMDEIFARIASGAAR